MAFVTGRFQATKNDGKINLGSFLVFAGIAVIVITFFICLSAVDMGSRASGLSLFVNRNSGVFYLAGFVLIISGVVSKQNNTSIANRLVSLCLNVDGDAMTLFSTTKDGESVCEIEFKWHETIIYEQIFGNSGHSTHEIIRTLQLRVWNEQTQVVIVGKVEDGLFPNYPVFAAIDLHKPDFISLEKEVVAKMSELIEKRPVAPVKTEIDLLTSEIWGEGK